MVKSVGDKPKNSGQKSKKIGGELETTNNRMELIAIIEALKSSGSLRAELVII